MTIMQGRSTVRQSPLQPGDPAPDFVLPAVDRDGTVSLADYRGKTPVLLAPMRGLYCAFCRRHIVQMGFTRQKLRRSVSRCWRSWPPRPNGRSCTIDSGRPACRWRPTPI